MAITLGAVTLPEDLTWSDEFNWTPRVSQAAYAINGALHLSHAVKLAGRPITLAGDVTAAWITRGILKDLYALLSGTGTLLLTLNDNRNFTVTFAPGDSPITAAPIVDYNNPVDDDVYYLSIKLIQAAV